MSDAQSEQRKIQRQIDNMTDDELDKYYGRGKYQTTLAPLPPEYDDEDDESGYD